jgi:hypothetical protein
MTQQFHSQKFTQMNWKYYLYKNLYENVYGSFIDNLQKLENNPDVL